MHDSLVLKILDIFRPLFEKFHIDYPIMRHILAAKLLIDERRVSTIFSDSKEKKKSSLIKSLWIYLLYGFILVFFIFGKAYMVQMSIVFGIALFILMTALIADFSPVMLDVRDRVIIRSKPVSDRTIGMAKFVHIMIYLVQLAGAFTIVPIIFMLFTQGILFTILFAALLGLFLLFIIALTALSYIFVLKFFSGERLKSIINYIQIIFAVGIIIGYQIIIRAYGFIDIEAAYQFEWWHLLLPPMWFAAPFELLINQHMSSQLIVMSILPIIVPVMLSILYLWLMPGFEVNLQKLLETNRSRLKRKLSFESFWEGLLCRTEKSRIYFQFVYKMVDREREFKLKVYPSLGIGLILPFIFIFSEAGVRSFEEITESSLYFCIYLMHIFIGIALYTFQFSNSYKGAWIFSLSGNTEISDHLYGAVLKVFMAKLYIPMFLAVGIPYYLLFQQFHLIDSAIVFVSAFLQALISDKIAVESKYPFSMPNALLTESGNMVKALLLMLLTIPFVIFHFLSTLVPFVPYIYFILLCAAAISLWYKFLDKTEL